MGLPKSKEMQKTNIKAVKERLDAYRDGERDIENLTEALERIKAKLEGVGAQEITDLPKSPSPPTDRMSDMIAQKIELEEELQACISFHRQERDFINGVLRKMKSADEKSVIRLRYMIGLSWYDVTDSMFGARKDYLRKEESYLRRVFIVHGRALEHIADIDQNARIS